MAITRTCLQSRGTIFCSRNLLNKFNKRQAETGRCFNKLNLILSGPGALLLQEKSASETSFIEISESIALFPADASQTIFCAGTESGHTFLAKSSIQRFKCSTLSLVTIRFRNRLAVFHRVLIAVSRERPSTKVRQYPRFLALSKFRNLLSKASYRSKLTGVPFFIKAL